MRRLLLLLAGASAYAAPQLAADLPIDSPVQTVALGGQRTAAAAFGAGRYLVVWQDSRGAAPSGFSIQGALFLPDGTADGAGILISAEGGVLDNPAVAFDGTRFVVTWEAPAPNQ